MKIVIILISISGLLLFVACRSSKVDISNYEKPKITFGSGGGFTGFVKQYCLTIDGDLFSHHSVDNEWKKVKTINKDQTAAYFDFIHTENFIELDINSPGNQYKFIEYESNGSPNKITWGGSTQIPDSAKKLYKALNRLVKKETDNNK